MKNKIPFFFLFTVSSVFAKVDPDAAVVVDEKVQYIEDSVNILNGSFFLHSDDLYTFAKEPLIFSRHYNSKTGLNYDGGWSFYPHVEITSYNQEEAICTEPDGLEVHYKNFHYNPENKKEDGNVLLFATQSCSLSFLKNTRSHILSGQTNVKNNRILFTIKKGTIKQAEMLTGDGTYRIYCLKTVEFGKDRIYKKLLLQEETHPNKTVTTYEYDNHFRLVQVKKLNPSRSLVYSCLKLQYDSEKKSNNHNFTASINDATIRYNYFQMKDKHIHDYFYLTHVESKSLYTEDFSYDMGYKNKTITKEGIKKSHVKSSDKKFNVTREPFVDKGYISGKQFIEVKYVQPSDSIDAQHHSCGKIQSLQQPVGNNNVWIGTHYFSYPSEYLTKVRDIEGHELHFYLYNKQGYPNKVLFYENSNGNKKLHHAEKHDWKADFNHTQLQYKIFYDPQKHQNSVRHFDYDQRGNIIQETIYGNLSGTKPDTLQITKDLKIVYDEHGEKYLQSKKKRLQYIESRPKGRTHSSKKQFCEAAKEGLQNIIEHHALTHALELLPNFQDYEKYSIHYQYAKNRYNLPTKKQEDNGLCILFGYKPDTDLITQKFVCDKDQIFQRFFYEYDNDNVLIKTIEDDGITKNANNLTKVSQRKITYIRPKKTSPGLHLPHIIEEKFLDIATKKEHLLKKTIYHYNNLGLVIKEDIYDATDTFRYSLHKKYDQYNNLVEITDPIGRKTSYQYDNQGNLILEIDEGKNLQTKYFYDAANRLIKKEETAKDGQKRVYQYRYNAKHHLIEEIDFRGNSKTYQRNLLGHPIKTTLPSLIRENKLQDNIIESSFDAKGNEIFHKDAHGRITKKEYNFYGKPTRIIHPDQTEEKFIYNLNGTLKQAIDQEGVITSYTYDVLGRELTKTKSSPEGKILTKEEKRYKGFQLTEEIDAMGNSTVYNYDNAGRKIAETITTKYGITKTLFAYDALGRVYKTISCNKENTLTYIEEKDLIDRKIEERYEDNNQNVYSRITYTYDIADNLITKTKYIQGKESITSYQYDGFSRIIQETDALGNSTFYEYRDYHQNPHGQTVLQKLTTNALGRVTIHTYDVHDNEMREEIYDPSGKLISDEEKEYDAHQKLIYQKSHILSNDLPKQVETIWDYDVMGRLLTLKENAFSKEEKVTSYTYTPRGQIATIVKPDKIILQHTYDDLGNQIRLVSSDNTIDYTYTHDLLGHVIVATDNINNQTTKRKVDKDGKLLHETLANDLTINKEYDAVGRCISTHLFDESSIEYTYDAKHLREVTRKDQHDLPIYYHCFTKYDPSGFLLEEERITDLGKNIYTFDLLERPTQTSSSYYTHSIDVYDALSRVNKMSWDTLYGQESTFYDYDYLNQLTQEKGRFIASYDYDSHYNRCSKNGERYDINNLNEILASPTALYTYDPNGNPLSKKTKEQEIFFTYDALDRLIEVILPEKTKVQYTYDYLHRRISKMVYSYQEGLWQDMSTIYFYYDGNNEIGACDNQRHILQLRILGDTTYAEIGSAIAIESNNQIFAPIHDLCGNITTLINTETKKNTRKLLL